MNFFFFFLIGNIFNTSVVNVVNNRMLHLSGVNIGKSMNFSERMLRGDSGHLLIRIIYSASALYI